MTVSYCFDLQSLGAIAALRVNGVEVGASWDALPRIVALDFGHAVMRGENRVELLLGPLADEPECELSLYSVPQDHRKHPFERFVHWVLTRNEIDPGSEAALERVVDHTFWLADAPTAWCWDRGRTFDAREHGAELADLVATLHAAFTAKNLRPIHSASRFAIEERAAALGVSPDSVRGEWLAALSEAFVDETFRAEPLRADTLRFETAFGGRLVHARAEGARHPLSGRRGSEAERAVVLPLSFAHLDGRWQVVR